MIKKKHIKRFSYLRALLYGIPMGIISMTFGIIELFNTPSNTNELRIKTGKAKKFEETKYFSKKANRFFNAFVINFENGEEFYTTTNEYIELLSNQFDFTSNNDSIKIWHIIEENQILQISKNGKMIYSYKPTYWIGHFFFWIGLLILIAVLSHIIKHPNDLNYTKK